MSLVMRQFIIWTNCAIINWTIANNVWENLNQNTIIIIRENALESVVSVMAAFLFQA